jgi:hypothetical protein
METLHKPKPPKNSRDCSTREEQILCLEALESGAYDDMSDQEWVALCERLAADARHVPELDGAMTDGPASSGMAASHTNGAGTLRSERK